MKWVRRTASGKVDRRRIKTKKTKVDGVIFDSTSEAARYVDLKRMQEAGLIKDLELQPKYPLIIYDRPVLIRSKGFPNGRKSVYRADFRYEVVETGEKVVEDHKGYDTYRHRFRRAVVEAIYGIEITLS